MLGKIKLSIIIPIHNGLNTFKIIFPWLIEKISRQDIEIIVVDNCSNDGLHLFLNEILDKRVKVVQLKNKLKAGDSLSIGIENAIGEWIYYIGDDDQIIFNSLNYILDIIEENKIDIIIGESLRYIWPINKNYIIFSNKYNQKIDIFSGQELAKLYINKLSINAGGSFIIKNSIYQKIKQQYGFFSTPQGVEFFILRAGLQIANKVALINMPLFIHGRADQGWGGGLSNKSRWSDESEWANSFQKKTFWNTKLYAAISYDAAITVAQNGKFCVDEKFWIRQYLNEILFTGNQERIKGKTTTVALKYLCHILKYTNIINFLYGIIFILSKIPLYLIRDLLFYTKIKKQTRAGYSVTIKGDGDIYSINKISIMPLNKILNLKSTIN